MPVEEKGQEDKPARTLPGGFARGGSFAGTGGEGKAESTTGSPPSPDTLSRRERGQLSLPGEHGPADGGLSPCGAGGGGAVFAQNPLGLGQVVHLDDGQDAGLGPRAAPAELNEQ